jgi:hypothetical protein
MHGSLCTACRFQRKDQIMFEPKRDSAEAGLRRFGLAAALAVAAAGLATGAQAAEQAPGMRVVKDPVTGELRAPNATEAAALEAAGKSMRAVRQAPRGLLTGQVAPGSITYADGTVQQELDESSLAYTVVRRSADGSTQMECVTGTEAADAALKGKQNLNKTAKATKEHSHDRR